MDISLDYAKRFLRIDGSEQDERLSVLIRKAIERVESLTQPFSNYSGEVPFPLTQAALLLLYSMNESDVGAESEHVPMMASALMMPYVAIPKKDSLQ